MKYIIILSIIIVIVYYLSNKKEHLIKPGASCHKFKYTSQNPCTKGYSCKKYKKKWRCRK